MVSTTVKILVLIVYVVMIIIIGIIGLRKTKTTSDFILGGGKVGAWMSAFSYGTAYFSAVLFIGFAGKIGWDFGISAIWVGIANGIIGVLGVWGALAWKIKQISTQFHATTMGEFFEHRYQSHFFKIFAAVVIFIFLIPYSAAVYTGLSYLFITNFGIEYWQALLIIGIFTGIYLVMGGYKSIAMIDVIFGIIMTIGVIVLLITTISVGNGIGNITTSLAAIDPKLISVVGPPGFWTLFTLVFLTSVAPFSMPHLVQKFYAIRDKQAVRRGMIASSFFALLIGGTAYFVGATTRVFLTPEDNPVAFIENTPIFDRLMPELFMTVIPETFSIFLLLLILAASMSTLASMILTSSSSFTKDFIVQISKYPLTEKQMVLIMRVISGIFVLLSMIFAYFNIETIVTILGLSWGALGSTFLGPFVWGLFISSNRINKHGALISGILGLTTCIVLSFLHYPSPAAGTIGMLVSFGCTPLFSIFFYRFLKCSR